MVVTNLYITMVHIYLYVYIYLVIYYISRKYFLNGALCLKLIFSWKNILFSRNYGQPKKANYKHVHIFAFDTSQTVTHLIAHIPILY